MKTHVLVVSFFLLLISSSLPQIIINGGFEQGSQGWTIYNKFGNGIIGDANFFASPSINPPVIPRTGNFMARLGGFGYDENSLKQTITLPNTTPLYLCSYYQDRAFTGTECSGLFAGAEVKFYVANQLLYSTYLCYYNTVYQWTFVYFDVSAAAGMTIDIVFRADAANSMWSYIYFDDISVATTVSVPDEDEVQMYYVLSQNFPNPFNPSTKISYEVPERGNAELSVYNVYGERIATLVNEQKEKGKYDVTWDASNYPSGAYFYSLRTNSFTQTKKMILLK